MALTKSEKIDMVQLAMKRVNVVPYEENAIQFGTNMKTVEISEDAVTVCEAYINVTQENRTCHKDVFGLPYTEALQTVK